MTYREAISRLEGLQMFGAKPGLDRTARLAAVLGHPQQRLRFIHVAGTNGKGSTCAMLESVYRQAGLRVGLFTSPHLVAFAERIQVNRKLISEADVVRLVTELWPHVEQLGREDHPTFFEVVTVMALRYFAEQQCELVIWETGLGGRLDATNIVTPLASVITNIHYDHQHWLGVTLDKIAAEKAGIIKPGIPVITATDLPEALAVITAKARQQAAPLTLVPKTAAQTGLAATIALPLLGEHQRWNAATAIATVQVLQPLIPVSEAIVRTGLTQVYWPGRLQLVQPPGARSLAQAASTLPAGQEFLLDGAHNLAGVEALDHALQTLFPGRKPAIILGILRDKDWDLMCRRLAPRAARLLLVNVSSQRSAAAEELRLACAAAHPAAEISCHHCLAEALQQAASYPFVVVTGSLYLVGEAMELLGLSPILPNGERRLNEWGDAQITPPQ
jgi:dihydrofolate synthase/folylpolyglutamate synthase